MPDKFVVETNTVAAEFNVAGALIQLTCKKSGWTIQVREALTQSFRMLVPIENRRNNPVFGSKQDTPQIEQDKDGTLRLTWRTLRSEHGGELDIRFTGIVRPSDAGLVFEAEVENNSLHSIECVDWPWLGDLSRPPETERLQRMNIQYAGLETGQLYPDFHCSRGFYGVDYPLQLIPTPESPFVLIDNGAQGLYAGYHVDHAEQMLQFAFELKPGWERNTHFVTNGTVPRAETIGGELVRTEFYCTHFPFFNPGESGVLHPVVLQPYVGTWHAGADYYKAWRQAHLYNATPPAWAQEVHSWQQIHINSPEDELRCAYKDLRQYGEECRKHSVAAIQLTGWNDGGQDRNNPSHNHDPRLGTWDEFRDAIADIQDMGVKMILFSKFTWADRAEERFRKDLIRHAVKDPYGDYFQFPGWMYQTPTQLADINTRRLIPMCQNSKAWRQVASEEFQKLLDLGAEGTLYDECQHHGGARYCFDAGHGHHVPAHVFNGDAPLAEGFLEQIAAHDDNFLLAGEACYDLELRHYSVSYFRINADHGALLRYVNPDAQLTIAVMGYNDRTVINQALMYRYILSYESRFFKGRLEEFPDSLEYGKKMDALRRRYADYLWDAEFMDTVGASVEVNGEPHTHYSVFVQRDTGKRAVVIANFDAEKAISAIVTLPGGGALQRATPEAPEPEPFGGTAQIPPLSTIVVMEA